MRTIKFRGKDRWSEEWHYGNLRVDEIFGRTYIFTPTLACLEVEPVTIGQFTGLFDKNGDKIYEGDILRFGNSPSGVCEVKWNESIAAFCIRFYFEGEIGSRPLGEWVECEKNIAIIGNIHDNPDILKGGEK